MSVRDQGLQSPGAGSLRNSGSPFLPLVATLAVLCAACTSGVSSASVAPSSSNFNARDLLKSSGQLQTPEPTASWERIGGGTPSATDEPAPSPVPAVASPDPGVVDHPEPVDSSSAPPPPVAGSQHATGSSCETDLSGLTFLQVGWHKAAELRWPDALGCTGRFAIAGPSLAVTCSAFENWIDYSIHDPSTLEPNFAPDRDPDVLAPVWMSNIFWFKASDGSPVGYQTPWAYNNSFVRKSLVTGTLTWSKNAQWFDTNNTAIYDDTGHDRTFDTRLMGAGTARAIAVTYLLWWPESQYNASGAASVPISLNGVDFCGV